MQSDILSSSCMRSFLPKRASLGRPQWEAMLETELPSFVRVQKSNGIDTVQNAMLGWPFCPDDRSRNRSPRFPTNRIAAAAAVDEARHEEQVDHVEVNIMKIHGDGVVSKNGDCVNPREERLEEISRDGIGGDKARDNVRNDANNACDAVQDANIVNVGMMKLNDDAIPGVAIPDVDGEQAILLRRRHSMENVLSPTAVVKVKQTRTTCGAPATAPVVPLPTVTLKKNTRKRKESAVCMHDLMSHRYLFDYRKQLDAIVNSRKKEASDNRKYRRQAHNVRENKTYRLRAAMLTNRKMAPLDDIAPQWRMPRFRDIPAHPTTCFREHVTLPAVTVVAPEGQLADI